MSLYSPGWTAGLAVTEVIKRLVVQSQAPAVYVSKCHRATYYILNCSQFWAINVHDEQCLNALMNGWMIWVVKMTQKRFINSIFNQGPALLHAWNKKIELVAVWNLTLIWPRLPLMCAWMDLIGYWIVIAVTLIQLWGVQMVGGPMGTMVAPCHKLQIINCRISPLLHYNTYMITLQTNAE